MFEWSIQRYAAYALAAAALFGVSTPFAKLLVGSTSPWLLAALLYLGSGIGLAAFRWSQQRFGRGGVVTMEAALTRDDLPWLAGAIVTGGIAAPVLLMWGLSHSPAANTALLLNLESLFTTLIAVVMFAEAVGARIWWGALLMLVAAALLGFDPAFALRLSPGAVAVLAACALWALDNNLTRRISNADPVVIAALKGLVAGGVNLALAWQFDPSVPAFGAIVGALALGAVSYGASLVLFIHALRHLGAARTAAHWSTAPFLGAGASLLLLGEPFTWTFALATGLMLGATWLVLTEQHEHEHTHERLAHSHRHVHDSHHQHAHRGDEGPEPHTHHHEHEPLTHQHAHLPDLHHRHRH